EVARLWGYDRIPDPATVPISLVPATDTPEAATLERVRTRLVGLGFRELYTNSLLPTRVAEAFDAAELAGVAMAVAETENSISREMAALRPSLLPGLLGALAYNQNRDAGPLRFFEFGHVYGRADDPHFPVEGYHEHAALTVGMSGPARLAGPDTDERAVDFFDLKGAVLHLLAALGLDDVDEVPAPEADGLMAYRLVLEHDGRRLGVLARLSDALAEEADLQQPLFVAELRWDAVAAQALAQPPTRYAPFSREPAVDRDVAVVVDCAEPVGPMRQTIRQAGGALLQHVRVFDLYEGERIEEGKKSVAFALRFGAERTLTDKVVDKQVRRIVGALEREHGARLRR
ncbi:MAG: phenylalanine--tRNA ligase subunit beta, partial [Rhodothermales bacterium]|nr:phenylalanine--tRNA ligase subunit beta [Rhodothermales bacterium]